MLCLILTVGGLLIMMGQHDRSEGLFYYFRLEDQVPETHLLRLIEKHNFNIVAFEADWPDMVRIDRYVRHRLPEPSREQAFIRFPDWMWRNEEFRDFADWLRTFNASRQDRTQWNGGVPNGLYINAIGRNTGEVFGVFADFAPKKTLLPPYYNYRNNSVNFTNLQALEETLPPARFIRIHKSYIVSVHSITAVRRNTVFIGERELPVSDAYREALQRLTQ